jgi:cyclophilin family peptidyl-prolyl cis-trans isomerase
MEEFKILSALPYLEIAGWRRKPYGFASQPFTTDTFPVGTEIVDAAARSESFDSKFPRLSAVPNFPRIAKNHGLAVAKKIPHALPMRLLRGLLGLSFIAVTLAAGTMVQFRTPLGEVDVELYDAERPLTVSNFLSNIRSGAYTNTFFHELMYLNQFVPNYGQPFYSHASGGLLAVTNRGTASADFAQVPSAGVIPNESPALPALLNEYGTLAVPSSPTNPAFSSASEFTFNLRNNPILDNGKSNVFSFTNLITSPNLLTNLSSVSNLVYLTNVVVTGTNITVAGGKTNTVLVTTNQVLPATVTSFTNVTYGFTVIGKVVNPTGLDLFVEQGSPTFTVSDIANLGTLISRLKQPTNAVAGWVFSQLSPKTVTQWTGFPQTNATTVTNDIVADFSNLISGPSIYDATRFAGISLRAKTSSLLAANPTGNSLKRLNHLLLEDAFPSDLAKSSSGISTFTGNRIPQTNTLQLVEFLGTNFPTLFSVPFTTVNLNTVRAGAFPFDGLLWVDITTLNVQVGNRSGGGAEISWNAVPTAHNVVEYTTTTPPQWKVLTTLVKPGPGKASVTDPSGESPRFYRVRVEYPE